MNLINDRNAGFTLLEVMIAVAILSVSILGIMSLQTTLMRSATVQSEVLQRIIAIKNLFAQEAQQQFRAETVGTEDERAKISGSVFPIADTQKKNVPLQLYRMEFTSSWSGIRAQQQMQLAWYVAKEPQEVAS